MVVNAILLWVDDIDMWNVQCDKLMMNNVLVDLLPYESPSKSKAVISGQRQRFNTTGKLSIEVTNSIEEIDNDVTNFCLSSNS